MSNPVMAGEKVRKLSYQDIEGGIAIGPVGAALTNFLATPLPADIKDKLVVFGLKQVLATRAAASLEVADKMTVMAETYETLMAGKWSEKRQGSGTSDDLSQTALDFAVAAAKLTGKDVEDIKGLLLAMAPDERKEYVAGKSKNPAVKSILLDIAAQRAKERAKAAAKGTGANKEAFSL